LVALYLAYFVNIGLGLIAVYLTLVNAVAHTVSTVVLRCYNPGLVTALVLFLPIGTWALVVIGRAPGVSTTYHVIGLAVAVLIHAAIIVHVKQRQHALAHA
jgi:Na+-translocating ferredoxin:NAD+ oxidoreductase RnfE subunit